MAKFSLLAPDTSLQDIDNPKRGDDLLVRVDRTDVPGYIIYRNG